MIYNNTKSFNHCNYFLHWFTKNIESRYSIFYESTSLFFSNQLQCLSFFKWHAQSNLFKHFKKIFIICFICSNVFTVCSTCPYQSSELTMAIPNFHNKSWCIHFVIRSLNRFPSNILSVAEDAFFENKNKLSVSPATFPTKQSSENQCLQ